MHRRAPDNVLAVDTELAVASKRDRREYSDKPIPQDAERRILDAGRVAGSARNRQDRRFVVIRDRQEEAVELVTRPDNLRGATLVIAIVIPSGKPAGNFDAGRAAQNMMLAAWNQGIVSCPNAIADADALNELAGAGDDEQVGIVLSFGFPPNGGDPARFSAQEWVEKADRAPLDQAVQRV